MTDTDVTYRQPHQTLAPHTSCRYAVVFIEAVTGDPTTDGYAVVAVHALCDEGHALVSRVTVAAPPRYLPPVWIGWHALLTFAPNSKDAWALRRAILDDDKKAERS